MKFFGAALLALCFLATAASAQNVKDQIREHREMQKMDRESLVKMLADRHDRRMLKLGELLENRKKQLDDHNDGRRRLEKEDHERVLRQVTNFQRKMDEMKARDPTEHQRYLEHEADSWDRMHSIDYIDFHE